MTLLIHRAERADRLADALGQILAVPLADPFASEIVAVPTQGVERWLAQHLSHRLGTSAAGRDGVCAGVDFPSPRRLTTSAVASALGFDARTDPWQPQRAVWPLVTVIDRAHGERWAALLWSYLGDPPAAPGEPPRAADPVRRGRRWSTAQHLAELFHAYGGSRPQMVLGWREGRDVDASGNALPAEYVWQAELWRRLRDEIGTPSPAERTESACRVLAADPGVTELPQRLSVFGATRLSPEHRAVLSALSVHHDVHLWLPHPSPVLWDRVAARSQATLAGPRAGDPTTGLAEHPLLAYLGRDVRELQLTLAEHGPARVDQHYAVAATATPQPDSLLRRLQQDLVQDRPIRPESDRPLLDPADRSLTFHASHGPDRQVEVLRELLVGLLADDPTLEPRDIVVMCPDIERFAPLISATFGLDTDDSPVEHPGHRLRVRLADRALRQVNPLLAALSRILALADSRMEASALLDLCAFGPVAYQFSFAEDDLERLRDLVPRAGVRWGLDAEHRSEFAMGQFAQNTWAAGLDRLLLGITMDETGHRFLGTALPLDDVDSSDVDLLGRLTELIDRLRALTGAYAVRHTLREWIELCKQTIEQLTAVPAVDGWQVAHAYAELASLAQVSAADAESELELVEVKALLADTLRGRASRANFRTGTLTMCTMLPMRSVPHRVICLLGVDDGVFPRHNSRDGDDILAAMPWIGDRDPRSEDRQLLLDAIMAAEEHLLVIYSGADARTRAAKPPAVPIGALLDAVDRTVRTDDGQRVRDRITVRHPLQPFDAANFESGALGQGAPVPFSFDVPALRGAIAASAPRTAPSTGFSTDRLPALPDAEAVALADLVRFFQHPVKALLRARAGLVLGGWEEEENDDQIPVRLEPLESWAVGDRLLRLHLDGAALDQLVAAEWRRGSLPPRVFGSRAISPLVSNVRQIAELSRPYLTGEPTSIDVQAAAGSHVVAGTLAVTGERLIRVNYSWLAPKHRLQAWIELLALTVSYPDRSWQAVSIGRGPHSLLGPVPSEWASMVLADLVDLYRTGLREPLPLAPKTSYEYARIRFEGKSLAVFEDKLEQTWNEDRDVAYERFFGARVRFRELLQTPSVPEEERGSLAEPSRFGTLARRIWHPLLGSEVLG